MASKKKLLQAAAGSAGGAGLDVDEVFSTYLYDGSSSAQTITNGIDLSGEGGMVWGKARSTAEKNWLVDSERGKGSNNNFVYMESSETTGNIDESGRSLSSFNSNGFTFQAGTDAQFNNSSHEYVSWTFRKAPKFFDVVTYSGTGSATTISHNLGSVPGMIIVKRTDTTNDWIVYHRGIANAEQKYIYLNQTAAAADFDFWSDTAPTSTEFSVNNYAAVNASGGTYVAYLFAHNNSDGEFGPDSDQDIIKCGSWTGNGSSQSINIGFEPQWVLVKGASGSLAPYTDWMLFDNMRGIVSGGDDPDLRANKNSAEATSTDYISLTATGLDLTSNAQVNGNGDTYIYMAIRRGPLAAPEDATDVFGLQDYTSGGDGPVTGIVTDFSIIKDRDAVAASYAATRLLGNSYLTPTLTNAEVSSSDVIHDRMDGAWNTSFAGYMIWGWKRAPSYFDVVAYSGTGSARTVSHNLGVAPEMIWVKRRDTTASWVVYHKGLNGGTTPEDYVIELNNSSAEYNFTNWNDTAPTSSVFSLGTANSVNNSSGTYIAYLFATVAGVSKVGSYTGNGSSQTIDCGFSSGARFILIKKTSSVGYWTVFDSVRGIVSGNDPILRLDTTDAEVSFDAVDPNSSGFTVESSSADINQSGQSYIFYAIA